MKVVAFPRRAAPASGDWQADELQELVRLFGADHANANVSGWDTGSTEQGEPQFYLLGPAPDHDCVLCVSRLAHGYVLEDGNGRLLGDAPSLDLFAEQAACAVMRAGRSFVTRATLLLCTIRLTMEKRLDTILEESEELLARFAPQIAALV
jgi:hypothetical protein